MVRYEARDAPAARVVAAWPPMGDAGAISDDWPLDDAGLPLKIARTCRPSRIDDWTGVPGRTAEFLRDERGIVASVGAPVVVEGHLWGALLVHMTTADRLPGAPEGRVAGFAELVATAIANAEARAEVERLVEEQAALRRVATLVAQGASPAAVFGAVAEEMVALLDSDGISLCRYEPADELTVLSHRGPEVRQLPPGIRIRHDGESVSATVRRTQRPARIDGYAETRGHIGHVLQGLKFRSGVGVPIFVDGRLWGATISNWVGETVPLPDTEERMAQFTQLLETAIANADSRDQLTASRARLVTEAHEARRRVVQDVHDGAQQGLVHTIITLKLARRALEKGQEAWHHW
jgi:GAF domain-containing protein